MTATQPTGDDVTTTDELRAADLRERAERIIDAERVARGLLARLPATDEGAAVNRPLLYCRMCKRFTTDRGQDRRGCDRCPSSWSLVSIMGPPGLLPVDPGASAPHAPAVPSPGPLALDIDLARYVPNPLLRAELAGKLAAGFERLLVAVMEQGDAMAAQSALLGKRAERAAS